MTTILIDQVLPFEVDDAASELASLDAPKLDGPLEVHVHVMTKRLAGHFGTGSMAGLLRESADAYPVHRRSVERGLALIARCDGLLWPEGTITALLVTCSWESERGIWMRVRQPPARTVGDLVRGDLDEAPVIDW